MLSLAPILCESGIDSDVMKPIAAPIVGGMITSTTHVLILVLVFFAIMMERTLAHLRRVARAIVMTLDMKSELDDKAAPKEMDLLVYNPRDSEEHSRARVAATIGDEGRAGAVIPTKRIRSLVTFDFTKIDVVHRSIPDRKRSPRCCGHDPRQLKARPVEQ